jgi:hypothetical protein
MEELFLPFYYAGSLKMCEDKQSKLLHFSPTYSEDHIQMIAAEEFT